jgi:hypothetical protein
MQIGGDSSLIVLDEAIASHFEDGHTIRTEIAKSAAQSAPRSQCPTTSPKRETQRLDLTRAAQTRFVEVIQAQHVPVLNRIIETIDQLTLRAIARSKDARSITTLTQIFR